jgi:hypothetical protein
VSRSRRPSFVGIRSIAVAEIAAAEVALTLS